MLFRSGPAYPFAGYVNYGYGTSTDGLIVGGFFVPTTVSKSDVNSWNGTAFSAETSYPYIIYGVACSANAPGSDGIAIGGSTYPPGTTRATGFTYDGSTWSSIPSLSTARYLSLGGGPSTAMSVVGGSPGVSNREDYNGVSWSSGTNIPSGTHVENGMSLVGPASDLTIAGGRDAPAAPYPGQGYNWDGTSWTTFPKAPSNPGSNWYGNNTCFGSSSSNFYSGLGEYTGGKTNAIDLYDGTSWTSNVLTYPTPISWIGSTTSGNTSGSGGGIIVGGSDTSPTQPGLTNTYS